MLSVLARLPFDPARSVNASRASFATPLSFVSAEEEPAV
jgi:hypothetical protein